MSCVRRGLGYIVAMYSWIVSPLMCYTTPCANAMIWCKCVTSNSQKWTLRC